MSLATRCPSCGTVFRVVQDQLRVSEGWVRCGRCNGVFNAAEVLFDIDSGAAVVVDLGLAPSDAAARPAPPQTDAGLPERAPPSPPPLPPPPPWPDGRREPQFDATAAQHAEPMPDREPLLRSPSRDDDAPLRAAVAGPRLEAAVDDHHDDIVVTDHVPPQPAPPPAVPGGPDAADETQASETPQRSGPAVSPVQAVPSFMRSAERGARWRRPAARAALGVGVAGLALALLAQGALLGRDALAARWPASQPALSALCQVAGCSVQPLRRIEALSVHSSGLNRLEGSTLYRLQVVLQNRADIAVMMPALELSLTDGQGRLVVRRALQAAELGAAQPVLQAGEELPIKALISTGDQRVDGYTLELFYP
ncbi:MAG: zinc-ribbon and DUF3426 domain-containing protein [Burkholderiaceae bacterium]|nr:zinc-ribbon and DUF3426 domain-containing protein [Burkholderiaceae bacterium]